MTPPARINGSDKNNTPWLPSERQAPFLEAAMQSGLRRSVAELAREAGVARSTVYSWMKDTGFNQALETLPREALRLHVPGVLMSMVHEAQNGNVQAARLVLESAGLTGKQGDGKGDTTNVTSLHLQVIERADDWRQFEAIKAAIDAQQRPMIEAQPVQMASVVKARD